MTGNRSTNQDIGNTNAAGTGENDVLRGNEQLLREALQIDTVGVILFTIEGAAEGQVTDANDAFLAMSGYSREDLNAGRLHWGDLTPPEWKATAQRTVAELRATGHVTPFEGEYYRKDGSRWWGQFTAKTLSHHRNIGYILDISRRKRVEEAQHESEERQAFLLTLSDALGALSDAAEVQSKAARVLGEYLGASRAYYLEYDADNGYGTVASDYVAEGSTSLVGRYDDEAYRTVYARIGGGRTWVVHDASADQELAHDEREFLASQSVVAWIDVPLIKQGELVAVLCVTQDDARQWTDAEVTLVEETAQRTRSAIERARAEEALRESERKLQLATAAARLGTWRLDLHTHEFVEVSNTCKSNFGHPPHTVFTYETLRAAIIPEDRPAVEREIERSIAEHDEYRAEYRIRLPDGAVNWIAARGTTVYDAKGGPVQMFGATQNITDQKLKEEALRENEERQAFLLALADRVRPLTDPREIMSAASEAIGTHLGVSSVGYCEFEADEETFITGGEYGDGRMPSLAGWRSRLSDHGPGFGPAIRTGEMIVYEDLRNTPIAYPGGSPEAAMQGIVAGAGVPLIKGGRLVSFFYILNPEPRSWPQSDLSLIREVADRTWAAIGQAQAEAALRESEEKYSTLFESIDEGFCIIEKVDTAPGEPLDFRYIEANAAFETQSGVRDVIGKTIRTVVPREPEEWYQTYNTVAMSGEPIRFERQLATNARVLDLYAFPLGDTAPYQVAVIFTDITERKNAEEERERARQEAEEAVRARNMFLSIASHELRNPVASIKGSAQLLRRLFERDRLDEQRVDRYTSRVVESSDRLAILVDDLLDVSRLQSGQMPMHKRPTNLAELVRDTIEERRPATEGHRLHADIQAEHTLLVDRDRIHQILVNVLDNAIKYSPDGDEVRILLTRDAEGASLSVQDQGIGLPESALESVFEPFGRAPNADETNIPGMGLGLYICRRIAEAHGGRLWAESSGEGEGTTMHLWLPEKDEDDGGQSPTSRAGGGR